MRSHFQVVTLVIWCCFLSPLNALVNSPKIISKDGHLIFESGLDRNISFVLKGKSRLNINDEYDILDLLLKSKKGRISDGGGAAEWTEEEEEALRQLIEDVNSIKTSVFGPHGMESQFNMLQNRTRNANQMLRRYKTRLLNVEGRVQDLYDRLEKNYCSSNPCQNGGECLNVFGTYMCKCPKNFEGTNCERDVNECALYAGTDLGCQNGALCINQFGSYSCNCQPGWFGIHCTQRKGDCMQSSAWEICGHGICVSSNDTFGYKCICDQGWKKSELSPACTVDVDECAASHTPCVTKCVNLPGSFTCAPCPAGLTGNGVSCKDIDECAMQNGGCSMSPKVKCINTYGSYHCGDCPLGWTGDGHTCERSSTANSETSGSNNAIGSVTTCATSNICHPLAKCYEISNTVVCSCPAGMVGSGIGAKGCVIGTERNCLNQPCLNGGTCIDSGNSFKCICPVGFIGETCLPVPSPCSPNPCRNNGRCRPITTATNRSFTCHCVSGFSGEKCEKETSDCGGILNDLTGTLTYPTGNLYDHNSQCAWIIRTNETLVLNVTFTRFQLEDSTECRFDWLQINDGRSAASQIIGRFCGTHRPLGGNIISSTNNLYLWFRSDNSTSREGFSLEWNSIPPQCGGVVNVSTHGTISSPGSPGYYPKNRDCRWLLKAPTDRRLKLTFFSLQIENHDSCNYDYLEIKDGISGESLEKFCTSSHPQPLLLPTNEASITFHSDNVGGDMGFQIFYSVEGRIPGCGGTYTAPEGIIQSPHINQDSISCEYDLRMPSNQAMTMTFRIFKMGESDCIEIYDVHYDTNEKTLQAKYCGDYQGLPPQVMSDSGKVLVKFYGKTGAEFQIKYKSDCSYIFESPEGVIKSPGYPALNNKELSCAYKLTLEPNTLIAVHFEDFDLKDSAMDKDEDCAYSSLGINDDMNKNIMGPYCGESAPPIDFVSKTNYLHMILRTSSTTTGRGFKMTYKSVPMDKDGCGGMYTKPGLSIRLPTNDEGQYMHDMECYWVIMAPKNKFIQLNWKSFKLEESVDCSYDYVEIYDNMANGDNNTPLGRFCDAHKPESILSHSRILTVKFVSDSTDAMDGFELEYEFVDGRNQCNGNIHSSTGKLNSPNWPANYTEDLDCTWIINTPPGTQLELQVEIFDVEPSRNCSSDWLEIRNGGSNHSSLLGIFCGNYSKIPHAIPSFTNQMYVRFHSNSFVNYRGFQIRWFVFSNGCGGNLQSDRGIITSPYYPNPYANNAQCEWRIHVHPGSTIHITIDDLDLETHPNCRYDNLQLFEGTTESKTRVATLCELEEENKVKEYNIDYNEVLVTFETDDTNRERGFSLSYRSNCTTTLTKTHGMIESPNYGLPPSEYSEEVNCTWTLKAPKGNHIRLEFLHFDASDKKTKLKILDGNQTVEVQSVGQTMNSTSDTLVIKQTTNLLNFRLEYAMVGCINIMRAAEGEFQSPQHPKPYPNNMECLWEIVTQPGQGIELTVSHLDLEESENCTKDALVISPHRYSKDVKERHCGRRDNIIITSSSHKLYVRFYSDGQGNGKGFEASYSTQKSKCGGILNSKNGIITSPNYPNSYPANSDCEWTIEVADHHSIIFTMEEMEIEDFYDCEMDYVEATEDIGEEDPAQIFKECGDMEDKDTLTWRSTQSTVTVHFHSDDSIHPRGFKLSYVEDCGQRMVLDDEAIFNIDLVSHTLKNQTCEWQLLAKDPSKKLLLNFGHVQMHPSLAYTYRTEGDCINKGAVVLDGLNDTSPVRVRFCKSGPADIISNGHAFTLKIPLNIISEVFAIAYTMDGYCGGYHSSLQGKFSSPHYPNSYVVNMQCHWAIVPSEGNSIQITFESMDLEDSEECNNDYVEIRDHTEEKVLGVYCGKTIPPTLKARGNVYIIFNSNDDIVGEGFLASYNYEKHNELNGTTGVLQSPAYPAKFHSHEMYSWRITVDKDYVVLLTIKHILDTDIPYIKFYDGYSDIGGPLEFTNSHVIQSNTNILYLTAYRGPFQFEWSQLSKAVVRDNRTAERMAEMCGNQRLRINSTLLFHSPGYPHGYADNMKCNWIVISNDPSRHAVLRFLKIDLEDTEGCFADYVRVSVSDDMENWRANTSLCKQSTDKQIRYEGTPYLRIEFVTDSSSNNTGFSAILHTVCGSELRDRRGFVNITADMNGLNTIRSECVWTIRVRQGRRIRLRFPDSQLNTQENCRVYFLVRNGLAEDSPFLGKGKYCESNITDVLETSSNRAYIKFARNGFWGFKASFHYEEITQECSSEVVINEHSKFDRTQTIHSPNYPNIPNPHTECTWKIVAPLHKSITLNFFGDFQLGKSGDDSCSEEYVQVNDGATELSPMIGRYCGTSKPNSIRSMGNLMRVSYFTDVTEPRKGFQANVTISRCGGFFYEGEGVVKAPDDLKLLPNEKELECVFTIETELGTTIEIGIDKLNTGEEGALEGEECGKNTHIEIQEVDAFTTGFDNITDNRLLCGSKGSSYIVETNKLVVRYKIRDGYHLADAFEITYKATGSRCHETIKAYHGILQTPNYPMGSYKPTQCTWNIEAPKGRRIKVEVQDFDLGNAQPQEHFHVRIGFFNDPRMTSSIIRVSEAPPSVIYSSGNTMTIDILILSFTKHRGVKLLFTAYEPSLYCRPLYFGEDNKPQTLNFARPNGTDIYCSHDIGAEFNQTIAVHVVKDERFPKSRNGTRATFSCTYTSPLQLYVGEHRLLPQLMCRNTSQPSFRLPFASQMILNGNRRNDLQKLQLEYTAYKCGGIWPLYYYYEVNITQPNMTDHSGPLECAWVVWSTITPSTDPPDFDDVEADTHFEIKLSTDFKGSCADEYLDVYNGPNQNHPHLGRFCSQSSLGQQMVNGGLFVELVTKNYNNQSTFTLNVHEGSGCGGKLTYPFRSLKVDYQYKNNVECIWELSTEPGFHLAAVFEDRFFIEGSANCSKDYLKIQQTKFAGNWVDLQDLQKLCGRSPPKVVNTTSTGMRLTFHTDDDVVGHGFSVSFERNCGGILYATDEKQRISSPGYPSEYPHNITCNYTIVSSPDLKKSESDNLYIRFVEFELEDDQPPRCRYDDVTIHTIDNLGNDKTLTLCGSKTNYEVRAPHKITVIFRTDASYANKGFLMEYGHDKCGAIITNSSIIESPRDSETNMFPHSSKCYWQLKAPENYKIIVKFQELNFEHHGMCTYDYVEVYKGLNTVEDQRLGKFCSNLTGLIPPITISQNTALIYSASDNRDASAGFKALVRFLPNCDKVIYLDSSNSSYDFTQFSGQYANNLDCSWLFTTTPDRQLKIEFNSFHVENSSSCSADYVDIRDGSGLYSEGMGKFCGHDVPSSMLSSRQALLVRFVTDGENTSGGFTAKITSIAKTCGHHSIDLINGQSYTLVSPNDGTGKYPNNINCVWKIKSDHNIHFKFEKLDIDSGNTNGTCSEDYLMIANDDDMDAIEKGLGTKLIFSGFGETRMGYGMPEYAVEHLYCGQKLPGDYFSSSKEVYVKFRTNDKGVKTGFKLQASKAEGCFRNFTGTQGRIKLSETTDHCDLFIKSPANTSLSLFYSDLSFSEANCNSEYLEVFDARNNTSLQKICEYAAVGKSLFTSSNELRLRLKLDGYYTSVDFTYLASSDGPGCGGNLYNIVGIFTNPFYPNNVRQNSDCRWNIQVPGNLKVFINFLVFNMGAKSTCHTDYLQLIEYESQEQQGKGEGKVVRTFCGGDEPSFYRSERSFITVHFHKTLNYDGNGWVIQFKGLHPETHINT
uniref:Cubilin n=2 Tax=Stomoxys calcitrans TaxID=35570 RepID=A0A1I8NWD8_STOCA